MPIKIPLFRNEGKDNPKQPDWRGYNSHTHDSVAGWDSVTEEGAQYIWLSFETKADKEKRLAEIKDLL